VYKSNSDIAKELVHKVLKWATEEIDNPDLRDRGFMYWRMLAISPAVAKEIILSEKPAITTDSDKMDRGALDQLLLHTGTLGSIYHKNPEVVHPVSTTRIKFVLKLSTLDIYTKRCWESIAGQPCPEFSLASRSHFIAKTIAARTGRRSGAWTN
jgi:vesicle coat complex subunit